MLLAVLLVIGGIAWLLIAQPWRGLAFDVFSEPDASPSSSPSSTPSSTPSVTASETETETPASTPTPTPEPSATAAGTGTAKPCVASAILVEAVTDADTYAAGQNPQLSIRLTNEGAVDCTLNVGTTTQQFTVTSGSDVWWRSTDCQTEPSDMVVLLAAGQSVSSAAPLTWDRTRSAVGTCGDSDRQNAPGGGASYHLSVEIGGIASTQSAQILLY